MAATRVSDRIIAKATALAFALSALLLGAAPSDDKQAAVGLTLEQASSRAGKDFIPAYDGRLIKVAAQVSEAPFPAVDQLLLALRDDEDFGLFAEGSAAQFAGLAPGDTVEATGHLRRRNGMPVLALVEIRKTGRGEPVGIRQLSIAEAAGMRNLALPIELEGRVTAVGENGSAETMTLFDGQSSVPITLFKQRRDDERRLSQVRAGDRIRVAGLLMQDATLPPYDRFFTLAVRGQDSITLLESGGMIPAYLLLSAVVGIGLIAIVWWIRDQRTRGFRSTMTTLHGVGEEILAATSLSEMLKKLETVVPPAARVSGCSVYLYNRKNKTLELVRAGSRASNRKAVAVDIEKPANGVQAGAALCFRNRAILSIPDTRRSELFRSDPIGTETPRSVLYLPMMAQDEIVGVIQLHCDGGVRYFHHEEQASAQHLANQVAASLRLLEQRSIREQLFKSEKLAATGQLIAGVVNDLRSPVESVLTMSQLLLFRGKSEERDLKMLAAEAQRTAEIVSRLISFGRNEDAVAAPVELNSLLAGLYKFREREWREAGIQLQDRASREAVHVIGAQGQLEQVFLNILLYAERAVAETGSKIITTGTALLGRRVLIDIGFPAPEDAGDPFLSEDDGGAGGLAVVRGIIQSHGGEVRFEQTNNGTAGRIEIELPRAEMTSRSGSHAIAKRSAAKLTAVILEPDPVAQRAFVSLLAQRGHRVIPLGSAEEAIDLVQRVKCDLIAATSTSSSRLPGFNWVNFYEKVRPHTDAFVLLTDTAEIGHTFNPGEGFVVRKPLHEAAINRVLDEFEMAGVATPTEVSL